MLLTLRFLRLLRTNILYAVQKQNYIAMNKESVMYSDELSTAVNNRSNADISQFGNAAFAKNNRNKQQHLSVRNRYKCCY